ncbi:Mpv17/PMP22 [Penicillium cf. griseofulvum]|uniref:Mpv17/PMP22 n=1 Tax=Penicillium cf. griseofulvum TaxID=2972120 RepID=A0A9W9J0P7_9EURO|nr:Mpv17/PMP22 [Penicillium cf. griseofulvum]KAJ5422814.1 Mpv17/PMP22 [Penicillium cf. griseofulvum]KAJ5433969.1 Mpv17/PMP22 [Penicillium cf. griseofulvum]
MAIPVAKATLQAALINAGSNVLAQGIKAYRADVSSILCFISLNYNVRVEANAGMISLISASETRSTTWIPFNLDTESLMQFTTCAFIISPLGYLWFGTLESWFPSRAPDSKNDQSDKKGDLSKPSLNVTNTVAKIVIDQTIGGAWNTVLFIVTIGMLRGLDYDTITSQIQAEFWPIMVAGLKLWPLVSILNFTVVPADRRLLVGNLFGVVWAIYLSLMSG